MMTNNSRKTDPAQSEKVKRAREKLAYENLKWKHRIKEKQNEIQSASDPRRKLFLRRELETLCKEAAYTCEMNETEVERIHAAAGEKISVDTGFSAEIEKIQKESDERKEKEITEAAHLDAEKVKEACDYLAAGQSENRGENSLADRLSIEELMALGIALEEVGVLEKALANIPPEKRKEVFRIVDELQKAALVENRRERANRGRLSEKEREEPIENVEEIIEKILALRKRRLARNEGGEDLSPMPGWSVSKEEMNAVVNRIEELRGRCGQAGSVGIFSASRQQVGDYASSKKRCPSAVCR
jgi:hypothetical protein